MVMVHSQPTSLISSDPVTLGVVGSHVVLSENNNSSTAVGCAHIV